jgi:hypothetical protein
MMPAHPHKQRFVFALLALPALFGAAMVFTATRHGIGLSIDSVYYVCGAREFAAGHGLTVPFGSPAPRPIGTTWAPLLSIMLSIPAQFGIDPIDSAIWLNAACFAGFLFLVGHILYRATDSLWFATAGSMIVATSHIMLSVHAMAWSEPPFLLFSTGALALLAGYRIRPNFPSLIGAIALIIASFVTRYAGASLVLVLMIVLVSALGTWRSRLIALTCLLALGFIPMTPNGPSWLGHMADTFVGAGSMFDTNSVQFAQIKHLALLPDVIFDWLTPWVVKRWAAPAWLPILTMSAAAIFLATISIRTSKVRFANATETRCVTTCFVMAAFALVFPLFLIAAILIFGRTFTFDERICLPMMTPALIAMLLAAFGYVRSRPTLARCAFIALALVLLVRVPRAVDRSIQIASSSGAGGQGYHDAKWRNSPTIAMLRKLPDSVRIYSNAPEAIYILTGRNTLWLPHRKGDNYNIRPLGEDLTPTAADIQRGAVVVLFDRLMWRRYSPSQEQVCHALSVDLVARPGDGVILCSPTIARLINAAAQSPDQRLASSRIASLFVEPTTLVRK